MRAVLVRLHRYAGLALAIFLIVAGLTGSAIAFNEEIDRLLNPTLFRTAHAGPALTPAQLAARVERAISHATVTYIPLNLKPGQSAVLRVEPTGGSKLAFDQVFADPVSGRVLGTRSWGACCLEPVHLMPFLYLVHYSLKIPGVWGTLLMGIVGIVWIIDCFVGLALTLPRGSGLWSKWRRAWRVKRDAGPWRLNFDLHRATGLWAWIILLIVASSGVAMNLPDQVFRPAVSLFSNLQPSLTDVAARRYQSHPLPALFSYDDALVLAERQARERGWHIRPIYVLHYPAYAAYGVGFARDGEDGSTGLGPSYYYFDDRSAALVQSDLMKEGSAGDVYLQAQYQLHTGRILGLPGRIIICITGLLVGLLSITGIVIWLRKRRVRA